MESRPGLKKMDLFEKLPDELILLQALELPLESITRLCQTSSRFNRLICNNNLFWHQKFIRDYGFEPEVRPDSWERLYREALTLTFLGRLHQTVDPRLLRPLKPRFFYREIMDFFSQANLGPLATGQFQEGRRQRILVTATLQSTNIPLNAVLFFTQHKILGRPNPLYGIIDPETLTSLFELHADYSRMHDVANPDELIASSEMRRLLPTIMNQGDFNQEGFTHFSKLISTAMMGTPSQEELESIIPQVTEAYRLLVPNNEVVTPWMIIQYQRDQVELARAYNRHLKARKLQSNSIATRLQRATQIIQDPNLTQEQRDALLTQLYQNPTII